MDLPAEARRLTLDVLAVDAGRALDAAGVPYALLKGPSTAQWLYDPPRGYRDVDLLVPVTRLGAAVAALSDAGLAEPGAGRVGEEAPHSLLLLTRGGSEIDVHVSLPTVPPRRDDAVWQTLSAHVEWLELDVGRVRALDATGRCLVLALHALNSGRGSGQPEDDLARARQAAGVGTWTGARRLATALGAADLFDGALAMLDGGPVPARARLLADHAPSAAIGLDRVLRARVSELPRFLVREAFPSPGFFGYEAGRSLTRRELAVAYVQRWARLARALPGAVRSVLASRRG